MVKIGIEERRRRLGVRHRLAHPATTVEEATAAMVGLHSSDPVTVVLSARARVEGFVPSDLEDALYERRSLVRMLGMRRTLFVVPVDLAAVMDEACTKALAPPERRRLVTMLEEQGVAKDGAAWLKRVATRTLAALERRGEATAVELTAEVPELGERLTFGEGKSWGGQVGVSTRVLFLLASEGTILRARPRGTWVSGQYRWAPTATWLGAPLPSQDHREASMELLTRWLRAFGPATRTDVRWWTGWTARQADATLGAIRVVEVDLDDGPGYAIAEDLTPTEDVEPWVRLLPGLDPTTMGWKERDWYLGQHGPLLFDRNGNAGPTVWASGRVVGGWAQAPDGKIRVELLERLDRRETSLLREERERLETWFGDTRITPRFRTPVEKDLVG